MQEDPRCAGIACSGGLSWPYRLCQREDKGCVTCWQHKTQLSLLRELGIVFFNLFIFLKANMSDHVLGTQITLNMKMVLWSCYSVSDGVEI